MNFESFDVSCESQNWLNCGLQSFNCRLSNFSCFSSLFVSLLFFSFLANQLICCSWIVLSVEKFISHFYVFFFFCASLLSMGKWQSTNCFRLCNLYVFIFLFIHWLFFFNESKTSQLCTWHDHNEHFSISITSRYFLPFFFFFSFADLFVRYKSNENYFLSFLLTKFLAAHFRIMCFCCSTLPSSPVTFFHSTQDFVRCKMEFRFETFSSRATAGEK